MLALLVAAALQAAPVDPPLVATHYFYWYRWPDQHFDEPGAPGREGHHHHLPAPETVSYEDPAWHEGNFRDMAGCGIDVALPVYWGAPGAYDRPGLRFSRAGLAPMVTALRSLQERGEAGVRLGLFYDTTTLLYRVRGVADREGGADLRTAEGKDLFCRTVVEYFAAIPEDLWARLDGRALVVLYTSAFAGGFGPDLGPTLRDAFAARFPGEDVFLVADASWGDIGQDRTTAWGAALAGPRVFDGVVQLGPGYDDSVVPGRRTPVRDREDGAFYAWSWQAALAARPELVLIETWNELHEGTEICATKETGRRYLDLTRTWVDRLRAGADPGQRIVLRHPDPLPRPDRTWGAEAAGLEAVEVDYTSDPPRRRGLREIAHEDGPLRVADGALRSVGAGPSRVTYLYFQVSDHWRFDADEDCVLETRRRPGAAVAVEYDSRDRSATLAGAYTLVQSSSQQEVDGWLVETWALHHARFADRQNSGADLRLVVRGADAALRSARLRPARPDPAYDVVIYGGTSAAVAAAVQVSRMGRSVVIVCPDTHLGGMSASGLGWTDSGDKRVIGGIAREFYQRLKAHYDRPDSWPWQPPEECRHYRPDDDAIWVFEPHVAEETFAAMLAEAEVPVFRDQWLERESGVEKDGARIVAIRTTAGRRFSGREFLDATYEGDLLAAAGVSCTVGREANAVYGETLNGVQTAQAKHHQFAGRIDPYVVPGDPASGLLPRIHAGGPGEEGAGDRRVQAYNYRVCLTRVPENRVPFPRPEGYDATQYELLLRTLLAGSRHVFGKFDPLPNGKTDTNNSGPFSTDDIGGSDEYPEASYARRAEILAEHRTYQMGYFWFLANDPRVPEEVRSRMAEWGLARDEFPDTGHWPHQIYVREARRMVGDFVMTELHLRGRVPTPEPVGMGSYNMDSHHTQRYVVHDPAGDFVRNEGDVEVDPGGPYPISYRALVPRRGECTNLLVPVCLSSSHIAYGSIRMEPVFLILGQSAATAAVLALTADADVQDVDAAALRRRLLADGQVLPGAVASGR